MEAVNLHFKCLDSTNTWCKQNYNQFDTKKMTLVTADQQMAGRGRFGRDWISPAFENVYASFTFFVAPNRKDIGNITQIMALSVIAVLKQLNFSAHVKWPNDIFINNKKIGGILCETVLQEKQLVVIVGIGLNINMERETLDQIGQPATSLFSESGEKYPVDSIIELIKKEFVKNIEIFIENGFSTFLDELKNNLMHKVGDPILINHQRGTFLRLDDDGALVIQKNNSEVQRHVAGEISFK